MTTAAIPTVESLDELRSILPDLAQSFGDEVMDSEEFADATFSQEVLAAIPSGSRDSSPTLFVMATMWVDMVGDSTSNIVGMANLKAIVTQEYEQAENMTTTATVFERQGPGPVGVLVMGRAGESDAYLTLYTHP